MERDFMGLKSKEEAIEEVLLKSSAIQWSLSNGHEGLNNHHSTENQKSTGLVQLTIFYRGMVNVYNDMSPEKAQAIMLLAGNGTMAQAQPQVATPRTPAGDGVHMSPAAATDAPKAMSPFRLMQSAVPQMRGASLARFLEKRRERVMASAPYSKSSSDSSSKAGSSNVPKEDDKK